MKIKIDKVNQANFIQFISKMKTIENFISLSIENNQLESIAYLPQRDAIKRYATNLEDIFDGFQPTHKVDKKIKIAFFDGSKLIEALRQFKSDMVFAEIDLTENENDFIATRFRIYNDSMEINLACSDPSFGFKELTHDQIQNVFNQNGAAMIFELDNETLQKVKSLSLLEKDETFQIETASNGVRIIGSTYSTLVSASGTKNGESIVVTLFKKYLNLLDREDYNVNLFDNKIMFTSDQQGSTSLVVSPCKS